ncbi:hypothetical protein ACIBAC_43720 [Streptomyces sp. NPDC051362]|uniref:hypothetical protein n=1 Tax=Streptomyces sp. NPDC051362 TaxID=3365651 RepID=UPI0037BBF41D
MLRKGDAFPAYSRPSAATGTLWCLLGWWQIILPFPSHACPDFDHLRPIIHFDRYESGLFPLQTTCYWYDGDQKELVAGWVNPLLFTCMAASIGCLVTLAGLACRRHRQQTN